MNHKSADFYMIECGIVLCNQNTYIYFSQNNGKHILMRKKISERRQLYPCEKQQTIKGMNKPPEFLTIRQSDVTGSFLHAVL
jgi:hypothetical protein